MGVICETSLQQADPPHTSRAPRTWLLGFPRFSTNSDDFLTDSLCFVCYQGSLYVICYSHCRCFALWFFLVFRFDRDLRALHLRWRSVWRRLRVVAGVASVNVCLSDSEAASLRCPCTAISVISSSSGLANRQSYTPIFAIEAFLCNDSRLAKLQGMTQDAWRNCPC